MIICSEYKEMKSLENGYLIKTNNIDVKIVFLSDSIVRVRAGFGQEMKEESYALVMTAWEDRMDPLFKEERIRVTPVQPEILETNEQIAFKTKQVNLVLKKNPIAFELYDMDGERIYADIAGNPFVKDSNNRVWHYSEIAEGDCFYGFGEKGGNINKANQLMKMNPMDSMGYDPVDTDSLYKHIPFYIKLNKKNKKAMGIYYHNTHICEFSMGREKSNYWKPYSKYGADGGDIDFFLIGGPSVEDVIKRYTDLTGKSAMLPKQALGYLGSSMYYSELEKDCDDKILEFVDINMEEEIPIDGFQLSSGYTTYKGKRCVFTWNKDRFKNPENFFKSMWDKGVCVSPNVKPGILLTHPQFEEFRKKGLFIKKSDGTGYCIGKWWGGDGAFVDFTSEENRNTWSEYLTKNVIEKGTTSVWNDNCEYDGILDKDSICSFEGSQATIGQLKSVMANLMCYTTKKAIQKVDNNIRPFIVSRSGYSGIQRYAQTWAGDNSTSWKSLKYNIVTILGMGLSGVANQGCDVGGFYGPAPEAELFVRWVQNGIFQPRFSIHSVNIDNTVTEPWMYREYKKYIRDAIEFRYQLIPYLYSLMKQANEFGTPIMRAMFMEFQNDINCYEEGVDFMFGKSLFVANVVEKGEDTRVVYFPEGDDFYEFHTRKYYKGGTTAEIPVSIGDIPMFIRTGGIIPIAENKINNLRKDQVDSLKIIIEPSKDSSFDLYEDDGISYDYKEGIYSNTKIEVQAGEKVVIDLRKEGIYESKVKDIRLDIIQKDKAPYWVSVNGERIEQCIYDKKFEETKIGWYYDQTLKSVQIKYENISTSHQVVISFEQFDMIGM